MQGIEQAHIECFRDLMVYEGSRHPERAIKKLVHERCNLLGQQIGQKIDLKEIEAKKMESRLGDYEKMLLTQYDLTKEEAAKLMDAAMKQEANNVQRRALFNARG